MSPGGSGPYPLQDLCTTELTAGCVPSHTDSVISGLTLAGLPIRPQLLGISRLPVWALPLPSGFLFSSPVDVWFPG